MLEPRIDQASGALTVGICKLPSLSNTRGQVKIVADEICANANLIAAAPELLAALERCEEHLPDTAIAPYDAEIWALVRQVRGAIAKAKGEAP